MKLFDKRPLSLILCIMLTVFVIFSNLSFEYTIIAAAFSFLLFIFSFILPKIFRAKLYAVRIAALLIIPTIMFSNVYFNRYFRADLRFFDEEVTLNGYVYEIDKAASTETDVAIIKTTDINGEPFSAYSLIAYFSKEESEEMTVGAKLTLTGRLSGFSGNSTTQYGYGHSAVITDISSLRVSGYAEPRLSNILSDYRSSLCRYIVLKSENTDAGGLFSALFIGEQDYLDPALKTDFKMIGISHILALSGMHLAIICLGLGKLLDAIGANRKLRCLLVIIFTFAYMAFTGFSSSVTRSGIMLILSSLLYLLSHTHDSVTSLFISVALICLIEPYAIFDLSLWLSAFATLGVLIVYDGFSEYDKKKPIIFRALRYILLSFLSSVFAISATMLLCDIYFGRTSIIAPLSSLIFGILAEAYMYIGFICLIIAHFTRGVSLLSQLYDLISNFAEFLSDIEHVYTYTHFLPTKVMILLLSALLLLFLVLNIKKKGVAAILFSTILLSIYTTSYFMTKYYIPNDVLIYTSDDGGDTLISSTAGKTCVIDSRAYSFGEGYNTQELIENLAISQIDTYILPVYYWKTDEMLSVLLNNVKIKTVAVPAPQNELEYTVYEKTRDICENYKIKLKTLENDSITTVGDLSYIPIYRTEYGTETQSYIYTIHLNDSFCTYISSGFLSTDHKEYAERVLNGSNTVILGKHGKKYAEELVFRYEIPNVEKLIFNSDNAVLNSYTANYYISKSTEILSDVTFAYLLGKK